MRFLSCLVICCGVGHLSIGSADARDPRQSERPNVVFILADDLGWRDLSNEGSSFYETPNIDRIAAAGMKFRRGYAACQVCSPSRGAIMAGKYPARLEITDWIGAAEGNEWSRNTKLLPATYRRELPAEETTIAEAFRDGGYRTFFAGKWHLGGKGSLPTDHGFDVNIGGNHRGSPSGGYFSPWRNPQMKDGPKGEYLPLRLGHETAAFIESHRDQPFFAFLSFYAVHAPVQTTQSLWKKYRDKAIAAGPRPTSRFLIDRTSPVRQVQDHPLYAGLVEAMDDAVGIVLSKLDELGLTEDTIIVFTSDNGGVSAGDDKATSNLPLRGGKGRQWEGGIRVPYYVAWPERIRAGCTCDTPVTGCDFFPTLLDLTGQQRRTNQHFDGVSLVPLLSGQSLEARNLYWHYPHYGNQGGEPSSIVIRDNWKLIHYYEDGHDELYDVALDIGEQSNLATTYPDRARALKVELNGWLDSVNARVPTPNPRFDAAVAARQQTETLNVRLPLLEREHAAFLKEGFSPRDGWQEVPRK
ncbi:MAG: sulfatase [Planctomycetaceae bacterium]|nr:sulfatase [Planctomycetaceae bacterium]